MHKSETLVANRKSAHRSVERGVSLIELMIAMTLGLVVIGAMTSIFVNNSQSRRELDKAAQQLENGRYAMQILKDELSLAGFYDALSNVDSPPSTSANPCSTVLSEWQTSMDVALEGVNGPDSFPCITTAKADTGMIFVQRASTATTLPPLTDDVAYLQVSLCGEEYSVAGTRFELDAEGVGGFDLKQIDCAAAVAPIRQYIRRIFFIDQNNVASDGIPTLKRVDFGAGQALGSAVALVEGIDDLHFEYAVDTDGNGSPDIFTEAPTATQWVNVLGVRVWLIARAIEPSPGYTDSKTYQLGTKDPITPADAFKRHVFSTYIELTHPAGRRAK